MGISVTLQSKSEEAGGDSTADGAHDVRHLFLGGKSDLPDNTSKQKRERSLWEIAVQLHKEEVAKELGLLEKAKRVGWDNLTAKETGTIGGKMRGKLVGVRADRFLQVASELRETKSEEK